jgi:signal transduction histidine kinase
MDTIQEPGVTTIIMLGTLGMTILVAGIGLFLLVYQKRILKEKERQIQQQLEFQSQMIKLQFDGQEQERKRISADLHDSLGSLLWGIKVTVSLIQRISANDNQTGAYFMELNHIIDESVEVTKRIAWELAPEAFQYSGFSVSVAKLCDRFNGKGIEIVLKENVNRLWNDNRALHAFRVIQELISNAIKHSKASILEISILWSDNEIGINVMDNGIGLQKAEHQKGLGMWNLNQRIQQLGGKVLMGVPPTGTGLVVDLIIPLNYD